MLSRSTAIDLTVTDHGKLRASRRLGPEAVDQIERLATEVMGATIPIEYTQRQSTAVQQPSRSWPKDQTDRVVGRGGCA